VSHYITIPINENGIVLDTDMNSVVVEAMSARPFNFSDVYLYSHGWANDAARALDEYNRFSVDFSKVVHLIAALNPAVFRNGPAESLGVGIHWPSQITESPQSALNNLELLTFYTMEHRADSVGRNAVYSILRLMLQSRMHEGAAPRLNLIGHSFGCKVVLAALQDLQTDIADGTIAVPAGTVFNVVLLEPATDNDHLDPGDIYGDVYKLQDLRTLITTSQKDEALVTWFHLAGTAANIVHKPLAGVADAVLGGGPRALGAVGPTLATQNAFGGARNVVVDHNFVATDMRDIHERLIVADLTPIHTWRLTQNPPLYSGGGFGGSHSDINFEQLYQLVCGFLFGIENQTQIPVPLL